VTRPIRSVGGIGKRPRRPGEGGCGGGAALSAGATTGGAAVRSRAPARRAFPQRLERSRERPRSPRARPQRHAQRKTPRTGAAELVEADQRRVEQCGRAAAFAYSAVMPAAALAAIQCSPARRRQREAAADDSLGRHPRRTGKRGCLARCSGAARIDHVVSKWPRPPERGISSAQFRPAPDRRIEREQGRWSRPARSTISSATLSPTRGHPEPRNGPRMNSAPNPGPSRGRREEGSLSGALARFQQRFQRGKRAVGRDVSGRIRGGRAGPPARAAGSARWSWQYSTGAPVAASGGLLSWLWSRWCEP